MSLTQTQLDLRNYALDRLYKVLSDVVQAARILEQPTNEVRGMLGTVLMQMSCTIALDGDLSKEKWMRFCHECWDHQAVAKKEARE